MLTLEFCEDGGLIAALNKEIFSDEAPESAVVLYCDKEPCGLACVYPSHDGIHISRIGVLPGFRGKGYGDFFARAVIYKQLPYGRNIIVDFNRGYFYKLGFKDYPGGRMIAACRDVMFPSECSHKEVHSD